MTIRIVTDSTCDLPPDVLARYGITVVPLYINIGDRGYLDGIDLSREEFYQRLSDPARLPSTAAPGTEMFRRTYEELANENATEILSIHVSGTLSATLSHARLGAAGVKEIPVTVFDSEQLSLGTGFLVMAAAKAVAEGRTMDEIKLSLAEQIPRTHLFAVLDSLEFLWRSGRVNELLAGLGSVLQIKPVFKVYCGCTAYDRVRTHKRAMNRLIHLLDEQLPLEEVAVVHTHTPSRAEQLRNQIRDLLPGTEIQSIDVSPVIAAHIGPDAVGLVCVATQKT